MVRFSLFCNGIEFDLIPVYYLFVVVVVFKVHTEICVPTVPASPSTCIQTSLLALTTGIMGDTLGFNVFVESL